MTALNRSTCRRLQKLPQISSVWEGDRRVLPTLNHRPGSEPEDQRECVLWVDGSQGIVRAMDVITAEAGAEAVVRVLLQAMEYPQGPAKPARPQKIVVRDRELQFFLRGVLQDLEIHIDYAPELPLIEEIFRGLQEVLNVTPPALPPQYEQLLIQKAFELWDAAPWDLLADHQIIAIELNQWDVGTLYASVMGLLGMEYGVLLYRSRDSLRQFRQQVLEDDESIENIEAAFLRQDCLFLTFDAAAEREADDDLDLALLPRSEIVPSFGNLHPLEGMRTFLHEEEAIAVLVALEALHRFVRQHHNKFIEDQFPAISSRYRVPLPPEAEGPRTLSVKVETLPELSDELLTLGEDLESEFDDADLLAFAAARPILRNDLFPQDAYFSLGMMPWEIIETLRPEVKWHQSGTPTPAGEGLPIILIQTTQPKAKELIEAIKATGGVKGIYFHPGEDPISGDRYDLGLLQTFDGELHLLSEFLADDPVHVKARQKWNQRSRQTQGWCGLVIARGIKGASRGNPQLKDMQALFEVPFGASEELNMGTLQLVPQLDW